MKISNSKKELAKIISENGGWRDGVNWAWYGNATGSGYFANLKPKFNKAIGSMDVTGVIGSNIHAFRCVKIPNWHQTILSRAEYFHIYPAPDADGWIEWNGGECPVDGEELVVCKVRTGKEFRNGKKIKAAILRWRHTGGMADIIAYRLHKPEQAKSTAVGDGEASLAKKELGDMLARLADLNVAAYKRTIEELAADYRNKLDYANQKQDEADKANVESDAALSELEKAIAAIGFAITPIGAVAQEPELVILGWSDWQIGDEVELIESKGGSAKVGEVGEISEAFGGGFFYADFPSQDRYLVDYSDVKFIRRPAK